MGRDWAKVRRGKKRRKKKKTHPLAPPCMEGSR